MIVLPSSDRRLSVQILFLRDSELVDPFQHVA